MRVVSPEDSSSKAATKTPPTICEQSSHRVRQWHQFQLLPVQNVVRFWHLHPETHKFTNHWVVMNKYSQRSLKRRNNQYHHYWHKHNTFHVQLMIHKWAQQGPGKSFQLTFWRWATFILIQITVRCSQWPGNLHTRHKQWLAKNIKLLLSFQAIRGVSCASQNLQQCFSAVLSVCLYEIVWQCGQIACFLWYHCGKLRPAGQHSQWWVQAELG